MNNCDKKKEIDYAFELCKQLHQQYAEADNNKTKSIIGLITAITFIFIGYGYVYNNLFYDEIAMTGMSVLVELILSLLSCVTINYGSSLRRDHVIVYNIRRAFFENSLKYYKIFGNWFNPIDKKPLEYLPDFYFMVFKFLIILQLAFLFFTCSIQSSGSIILFVVILSIFYQIYKVVKYYKKYKKFSREFPKIDIDKASYRFDFKNFPEEGSFELSEGFNNEYIITLKKQ